MTGRLNMLKAIRKAETLIEALPYIKEFHGKIVIIKYGGSAIVNRKNRLKVLEDIVFMKYAGMYPVLVHGGGPLINRKLRNSKVPTRFVKGLRVTDKRTLVVIKSAISKVNRQIVREIKMLGGKAKGVTTRGRFIRAKKKTGLGDIGLVGRIVSINTPKIRKLFKKNIIPVVSPLGVGRMGKIYNINADETSAAIASFLMAEKLALVTNVDGILRNRNDNKSLISTLTTRDIKNLMFRNVIDAGMIPKVKAGMTALKNGVKKVHIINGSLKHALLLEIFTDKGIGTQMIKE